MSSSNDYGVETPDTPQAETNCAEESDGGSTTRAAQVVQLALERYRMGRTEAGEPFAVAKDGPNIAMMFRGNREVLKGTLSREYHREYSRIVNSTTLTDAMTRLHGEALEAKQERVGLRVAQRDDEIVIDLGDQQGRAVIVRQGDWDVVDRSPVLFRRTALTSPLPVPERGGDLSALRSLLNVGYKDWLLLQGFLVAAFFPSIPHPILMLGGEQGTGKTSAARMIVDLIDPSSAPTRAEPRSSDVWAIAAAASWVVCVDNLSRISGWWSDDLCKAVTGEGSIRRKLYTDADISVVGFRRVVILTSIDAGALRGDLGDRVLLVDLQPIPDEARRTEAELDDAYNLAKPKLFGAILDRLAGVLERLPNVNLPAMPRMADFSRILAACDALDGLDGSDCCALTLYIQQSRWIAYEVVEADPVGLALVKFVRRKKLWSGTASELLRQIAPKQPGKSWPKSGRGLAAAIKRLRPSLCAVGVEVGYERSPTRDRTRTYTIRFIKRPGSTVQTVQQSEMTPCRTKNAESVRTIRGKNSGAVRPRKGTLSHRNRKKRAPSDGSDGERQLDHPSDKRVRSSTKTARRRR